MDAIVGGNICSPQGFKAAGGHGGIKKGSTKLGKALIAAGFSKSYTGGLEMWNPSGMRCQNVDTLEEGAIAAARLLTEKLGVKAYAQSRLD